MGQKSVGGPIDSRPQFLRRAPRQAIMTALCGSQSRLKTFSTVPLQRGHSVFFVEKSDPISIVSTTSKASFPEVCETDRPLGAHCHFCQSWPGNSPGIFVTLIDVGDC